MSKRPKVEAVHSARDLALDILAAAPRQGRSVEELLAATLKRQPLLRPERAFLLELVQGVKRWELKLDYLIAQASALPLNKLHPMVLLILRLAAFQLLMLDRVPARAAVHGRSSSSGSTRNNGTCWSASSNRRTASST